MQQHEAKLLFTKQFKIQMNTVPRTVWKQKIWGEEAA